MGFYNIIPEVLLLVADNLSLGDLVNFCSTCSWVGDILTPRFQKLCLQDVGELTVVQWAAVRGHDKLIKLAKSNGADIDIPYMGDQTLRALGVRGNLYENDFREPGMIANTGLNYTYENTKIRTPLFLAACCGYVKAINVLLYYVTAQRKRHELC